MIYSIKINGKEKDLPVSDCGKMVLYAKEWLPIVTDRALYGFRTKSGRLHYFL